MKANLLNDIQKHGFMLIQMWKRLPDEYKYEVSRLYRLHVKACSSLGIEAEPNFLPELIGDLKRHGMIYSQ